MTSLRPLHASLTAACEVIRAARAHRKISLWIAADGSSVDWFNLTAGLDSCGHAGSGEGVVPRAGVRARPGCAVPLSQARASRVWTKVGPGGAVRARSGVRGRAAKKERSDGNCSSRVSYQEAAMSDLTSDETKRGASI